MSVASAATRIIGKTENSGMCGIAGVFGKSDNEAIQRTKRVLVTGATGFIGSNLLPKFVESGYQVYGISKRGGNIKGIQVDAVDCTNWEQLASYCAGKSFDSIVHLAALLHSRLWGREDTNISMLQNVAMVANLMGIIGEGTSTKTNFVYASSISVYGSLGRMLVTENALANPNNPYLLGKYFGELLCRHYQEVGFPIAILRISAPYGLGMHDTVVNKFLMRAMVSKELPLFREGDRSQDFVYIKDILEGIELACKTKANGIFNISSGKATSMKELAEAVLKVVPYSKSKIVHIPLDDPERDYQASYSYDRAKRAFGYQPMYSLEMGLKETGDAMKREL